MKNPLILSTLLVAGCFLSLPSVQAQTGVQLTTSGDRSYSLTVSNVDGEATDVKTGSIRLDASSVQQTMEGFGFAMTYSSCYNLMHMSKADRTELLTRTFSSTEGYGVNYVRISIGCSDFSSTEYTLCDEKGPDGDLLKHFRLFSDETDYVIPILKEVLAINPDLLIMGSPWTCPRWMKIDNMQNSRAHNEWTDGHLAPQYYTTYADYFVRFIQAFEAEGIHITCVTPQNEPLNPGNCASLVMNWNEEAGFVQKLAPAIKRAGLNTKIWLFDHNYNYDNKSDQQQYPARIYDLYKTKEFEGKELVVGAAYHNYGGNSDELNKIHDLHPDKGLIFSEASIGTWNHGRDLDQSMADIIVNVGMNNVNKHCVGVIVWNFMLDMSRGPNLDGGCQTCYGAVDVADDYSSYTFNSHYYTICHFASVVRPGAVHISTSGWNMVGVSYSAFRNPDGTLALVLYNANGKELNIHVTDGMVRYPLHVPARAAVSLLMDNRATGINPLKAHDCKDCKGDGCTDGCTTDCYTTGGIRIDKAPGGAVILTSEGEKRLSK